MTRYQQSVLGSSVSVWPAGDPHWMSLDGLRFTFNGMGEYVLLRTASFVLQVRTHRAVNTNDEEVNATVVTAVAATTTTSDRLYVAVTMAGDGEPLAATLTPSSSPRTHARPTNQRVLFAAHRIPGVTLSSESL